MSYVEYAMASPCLCPAHASRAAAMAAAKRLGVFGKCSVQQNAAGEWRAVRPDGTLAPAATRAQRLAELLREETVARRERLRRLEAELGPRPAARAAGIPIDTVLAHLRARVPLMIRQDPK